VKTEDTFDKINNYNKGNYEIISITYKTADSSLSISFRIHINDKFGKENLPMNYELIDSEKNEYEVKFVTEKLNLTEDDYRELLKEFDGYKKIENINIKHYSYPKGFNHIIR
jgi:hypothetical protein